jgi:chemotaxis protein MotB
MKSSLLTGGVLCMVMVLFTVSGCVSKAEYDKCMRRNQIQLDRISALEEAQEAERLRADRIQNEMNLMQQKEPYWQQKIDALMAQLNAKQAMIDQLSAQVGQSPLPPELNTALSDWARQVGSDVVEYDEKTGIVRFKSDLLFEKGSDVVAVDLQPRVESLAQILNSPAAQDFDVLIVGHTDDIPIKKPVTLAKHPSNWHLSAHRAISVERILAAVGIMENRLSVMGMGQFRPIAPNAPGEKGNPLNRRVEIYIVPAGSVRIAAPDLTGM